MKEINVTDRNDREIIGDWNGKIYDSGYPNCVRIYLNQKEYHIDKKVMSNIVDIEADVVVKKNYKSIDDYISKLPLDGKIYLFQKLYYDRELLKHLNNVDARAAGQIHKAIYDIFESTGECE